MKLNLEAIAQIESSGNPLAHNTRTNARGLFQITPVCLDDYNAFHKEAGSAKIGDLFNARVNRFIAQWYLETRIPALLRHYGFEVTVETVLMAYNWGIGNMVKKGFNAIPKETQDYIQKYRKLTGK